MKTVDIMGKKQAKAFPDLEIKRREIEDRVRFLRSEKERLSDELVKTEKELEAKAEAHNGLMEVMNALYISELDY